MPRTATARKPAPRQHTEERRLVTYVDAQFRPVEKRKRATVFDGLLAMTDDGTVIHVPTGRHISSGFDAHGADRDILDDRKFILWMLDQDPDGWESSRSYKLGEALTEPLRLRLKATRDSYPGDDA